MGKLTAYKDGRYWRKGNPGRPKGSKNRTSYDLDNIKNVIIDIMEKRIKKGELDRIDMAKLLEFFSKVLPKDILLKQDTVIEYRSNLMPKPVVLEVESTADDPLLTTRRDNLISDDEEGKIDNAHPNE